jgi:hypothetical protein
VLAVSNPSSITKLVVNGLQAGSDNYLSDGPDVPGVSAAILTTYNNSNLEIEVLDDAILFMCFIGLTSIKKITATNVSSIADRAFAECSGIK